MTSSLWKVVGGALLAAGLAVSGAVPEDTLTPSGGTGLPVTLVAPLQAQDCARRLIAGGITSRRVTRYRNRNGSPVICWRII